MFLTDLALPLLMTVMPAQVIPTDTLRETSMMAERVVVPGSAEEDRLRSLDLLDPHAPTSMLRSVSTTLEPTTSGDLVSWTPLAPSLETMWNSDLPFSLNEGSLWAARGLNARVLLGVRGRIGPLSIVLAPEFLYWQNADYQTFSRPEEVDRQRHRFASPFHYPPYSVDLPIRFGQESASSLGLGQSSVTIGAGPVSLGAATESLWWGPGIRNGLVMSSNAPGIPHLFARTSQPLDAGMGTIEGRMILGRLEESAYFDFDPSNDYRSISALALAFTPSFASGFTMGFTRSVYAPREDGGIPFSAALDVLRNVGRPAAEPGDSLLSPGPDQIFSLFVRWHLPDSGVETYAEWGRYEQPASVRDFLEMPHHTQGYTLGAQWARPVLRSQFRLQTEVTSLEPSTSYRVRPVTEWYSSRRVPQGYTHRGRVIGASVGPSGSSQWLAADLIDEAWHGGLFLGRIRWENQAQFTYPPEYRYADVSLFTGLRAGIDLGIVALDLHFVQGIRYNYLFQVRPLGPFRHRGVDIHNRSVRFTVTAGSG